MRTKSKRELAITTATYFMVLVGAETLLIGTYELSVDVDILLTEETSVLVEDDVSLNVV